MRPDEVRAAVAARIASEVPELSEMASPYWTLRRGGTRSAVHLGFAVGVGRVDANNDRQRTTEGTRTETVIRVAIGYQLERAGELDSLTEIGLLKHAIRVALLADWTEDIAMLWRGDPEDTATPTLLLTELEFIAIHQTPLE